MTVETLSFTVGNFKCVAINDGDLLMGPSSIFFGGSSEDELAVALKQYGLDADGLNLPCTCLYIDTGEQKVLIDCGSGLHTKHAQLGQLFAGLEQIKVSTESITHVILSHGHWDHVGGCADDKGNILFPNARFLMMKAEHDYWMNETPRSAEDSLHITQARLKAIQSRLDFIDIDKELVAGIRAIYTPGHTFDHISFEITSNGEMLICIMDVMDHPLQIEYPMWGAEWDLDHEKSVASRKAILQRALENNALMHGFHFPFPGLGHIAEQGTKTVWKSISD